MINRIYFIAVSIFLCLNIQHALATDISIYRWVDENNIVHFSQNQPTKDGYSQLSVFSAYKTSNKNNEELVFPSTVEAEKIREQQKIMDEIALKNKETYKKNCEAAKLNIKMLNSFAKVLYTDKQGKSSVLSPKEKQEQITLSKKHINLYCTAK